MSEKCPNGTERSRGILTPADRQFLRGETDYASDQSERDARYRIRERFYNGILDLEIALRGLDSRDISMVMDRLNEEDIEGIIAFAEYLDAARAAEEKRERMLTTLDRDKSSTDTDHDVRTDGGQDFEVIRTLDASDLRIRVGVADDPEDAIAEALGTDVDTERALRLVDDDGPSGAHITLDHGLWAIAKTDDGWREGPATRENILAGLLRAESVHVVPYDETPFTGEVRHPSQTDRELRADGGHVRTSDVDLAAHDHANALEAALDYVMEAARRARDGDVAAGEVARLQLAECGTRLAFFATSEEARTVGLHDATEHLQAAVERIDAESVGHPVRHALQLFAGYEDR